MNFKKGCKPFRIGLIQGARPQEKGLAQEFEKEGKRLGILFNGMQQSNHNISVALFTDNKTNSTFGVESGQSVLSKLIETRKRFRFNRSKGNTKNQGLG